MINKLFPLVVSIVSKEQLWREKHLKSHN